MSTTIYYFTGTGNSLAIARKIAAMLPETSIESIADYCRGKDTPKNNGQQSHIGFVFPTYAYGLPRIVKDFVETVELPDDSYLYAVASCCGIPGTVLKQLDTILRKQGRRLHSGFTVLNSSSSLINDPDKDGIQRMMISASQEEKPEPMSNRIDEIVLTVSEKEVRPLETSNRLTNFIGSLLHPMAINRFKTSSQDFHTNGSCIGCGFCAQLCPRENIEIRNKRPEWRDDCELCHACIQWCPNQAIQYKDLTENKPRYRNPEVTVNDMFLR